MPKRKWPIWRKRQKNYVHVIDRSDKYYEEKNNPPIEEEENGNI